MTVSESLSYVTVVPAWAAPLSHPKKWLSLMNGKGEEILLLPDLNQLDPESRRAVETELERRYLTSIVTTILDAKVVFGATYWTLQTDKGQKEIVTQSLQENALWLGPHHLLLIDIDGNRFEIPNVQALDPSSRKTLEAIV